MSAAELVFQIRSVIRPPPVALSDDVIAAARDPLSAPPLRSVHSHVPRPNSGAPEFRK
jgi:hypothetical protein